MDRMTAILIKLAQQGYEVNFQSHVTVAEAVRITLCKDDLKVVRVVNKERWKHFYGNVILEILIEMRTELDYVSAKST